MVFCTFRQSCLGFTKFTLMKGDRYFDYLHVQEDHLGKDLSVDLKIFAGEGHRIKNLPFVQPEYRAYARYMAPEKYPVEDIHCPAQDHP